jgi:hypothetical protein
LVMLLIPRKLNILCNACNNVFGIKFRFRLKVLAIKLAARTDQADFSSKLSEILKQEPIGMSPEEVDYVVGHLADDHPHRDEFLNFLNQLSAT